MQLSGASRRELNNPFTYQIWQFCVPLLAGLALIAAPRASLGQADSSLISTPEIQVKDHLEPASNNALRIKTYRSDSLGNFDAAGLEAVSLLGRSEGVHIQDYGGRGGVKTVSLRGFASNQTTVSVQGVPYASPATGVVNFAGLSLPGLSAVEIAPGGGNLAQNVRGGNIDLRAFDEGRLFKYHVGAGAFGMRHADAFGAMQNDRVNASASFSRMQSEENYPFDINENQGRRENARFATTQLMLKPRFQIDSASSLEYFAFSRASLQETPGAIVKGNAFPNDGVLSQNELFHFVKHERENENRGLFGMRKWKAAAAHHYDFLELREPLNRDVYTSHQALAQAESEHLAGGTLVKLLAQTRVTYLEGNNLGEGLRPIRSVRRDELNFAASANRMVWQPRFKHLQYLYAEALARANITNQYPVLPNASIGVTAVFDQRERHSAYVRASHSHRLPAFNELYYFNFGNSDLQPEEAEQIEAGYWGRFSAPIPFNLKIGAFATRTQNKIVSVPVNPVRWTTIALGNTRSRGATFTAEVFPANGCSAYANFTWLQTRDFSITDGAQLPYTPNAILAFGANYNRSGWRFGAHATNVSDRYASLQNDSFNQLPGYFLLDVYAGKIFDFGKSWKYELEAAAQNLTDTNYAVIRSFPMPGRSWRIRAGILFR